MNSKTISLPLIFYLISNAQQSIEIPRYSSCNEIVRHTAYILCYDTTFMQARWVEEMLTSEHLKGKLHRNGKFRADFAIRTRSATPEDYKGSGYDRGHLAPAADFKMDSVAMSESFLMVNISPQTPSFNRGIWEHLEDQVREWANVLDTIYVVTGPVLKNGLPTIGTSNVAVPQYYYKVVLDYKPPIEEAIGFILRNEGSKEPLAQFAVTVDSVEKATGIEFFPSLPDSIENRVEKKVNLDFWHLNGGIESSLALPKPAASSAQVPLGFKRMKITRHKCSIDCPKENRIGAACGDGTISDSIGHRACAGHGGVVCWECK